MNIQQLSSLSIIYFTKFHLVSLESFGNKVKVKANDE